MKVMAVFIELPEELIVSRNRYHHIHMVPIQRYRQKRAGLEVFQYSYESSNGSAKDSMNSDQKLIQADASS